MNVIEHIEKNPDSLNLFLLLKDEAYENIAIYIANWEASYQFYVTKKDEVNTLDKALVFLVIRTYVDDGEFYLGEEPWDEKFHIITRHLRNFYGDSRFSLNNEFILSEVVSRLINNKATYSLNESNRITGIDKLSTEPWTKENVLLVHSLYNKWNNEDYLIETENHFIRYNWATSA